MGPQTLASFTPLKTGGMYYYCYTHFTGKETEPPCPPPRKATEAKSHNKPLRKVGLEFTPRWIDSGASQVVQWLQNLSTRQEMMEIQVQFLGGEDPLEEGVGTPSGVLAWRIRGQRRLVYYSR